VAFTLPLTTLLLLPAISLFFGGYISASTDYSNQLRFVLARAAAVGPIYGVLLTFLTAIFGSQNLSGATLAPSWGTMLLFSVVIGTIFASLGGLVKIFRQRWRAGTLAYLLSEPRGVLTAGMSGALGAVATGLVLSLPVYLFGVGLSDTQQRFGQALISSSSLSSTSASPPEGLLLILYLVLALPGMVTLLAFGSGASISASGTTSGLFS